MYSHTKKITAVFLSLVMLMSAFSVCAFAKTDDTNIITAADAKAAAKIATASDEISANIILPGISQSNATYCDADGNPILKGDGGELSGGLLIIDDTDLVPKLLKQLLWPLLTTLFLQRTNKKLAERVRAVVDDLFSIQRTDKTGRAVNNLVLDTYPYPLSEYSADDKDYFYRRLPMWSVIDAIEAKYGVDGEQYTYLYTFPLIGDPMESAAGLKDFIALVKEQTGCSKVNLIAISMGGSILSGYLDLVREDGGDYSDIDKIINIVAALDGSDIIADFYARSWNLDDGFLYGEYVPLIMEAENNDAWIGHAINVALRILPKDTLYTILTAAFDGILENLLLYDAQFWATVPSDRYEELADRYFSTEDTAEMRARTDRFQTCRVNLKDNLQAAVSGYGVEVYSVAGYDRKYTSGDYAFLGIVASNAGANSDSIIDIDSTTLGTTYAPAGEKLAYEGGGVSPDGSIDISTAMFPDTTWFFHGQHHEVGRDDVIIRLLGEIVANNIKSVNDDERFPQFNNWRLTWDIYRRDSGLLKKAETVLNDETGAYTEEQKAAVRPVYEKAVAFLENTVMGEDEYDKGMALKDELNDALAPTGLTNAKKAPAWYVKILEKIFTAWDACLMKTVGGQGVSDKVKEPFEKVLGVDL